MWHHISQKQPNNGDIVLTKLQEGRHARLEQELRYSQGMWWLKSSSTPIEYTPTHWTKEYNPAHYKPSYA